MAIVFDITKKPTDENEYIKWMEEKFDVQNDLVKNNYSGNAPRMLERFKSGEFWKSLGVKLGDWDVEYYIKTGVHLFVECKLPEVVYKPYDSLINKAFRKNCLKNEHFPDHPEKGWVSPYTWFDDIHDIIRTSFVVKYLDGVKFLVQKMEQISKDVDCGFDCSYEAHDDGYYAAHVAIVMDMTILGMDWKETNHKIEIEIQITTGLQEMIKQLLHKFYEDNRRKEIPKDYKWQWDYDSEQFVPNYLGHISHYLEGMIVEIRDKK